MFLLYMNPILIAAAVVPAVFLLIRVYRADRLEPEPSGLLLSLILRGVFATVIAMVLEELRSALLGSVYAENSLPYNVIMYFVIVAFSEEGAKYILLRRRTWCSDAFNCQFDGVVYAVFVSLGFALWGKSRLRRHVRPEHRARARRDRSPRPRLLRRVHGRLLRPRQAL